ncbi:short transient receptor potential channel 3-like [Tubulanus polymorphus]|uniref:short transient receptor potential channel 3-like n=1 Tax=Tubulanus polymorphus TaxID=672921 RepID=UPI003DA48B9C
MDTENDGRVFEAVEERRRIFREVVSGFQPSPPVTEQQVDDNNLLHASEIGDVDSVRLLLDRGVNVSCRDDLDRTPLQRATTKNHKQVVELLADRSDPVDFYEAVLSAVRGRNGSMACFLVNHERYKTAAETVREEIDLFDSLGQLPTSDKRDKLTKYLRRKKNNGYPDRQVYSGDTASPLVLAAKYNLFEVVATLLKKGETITEPHPIRCRCQTCRHAAKTDPYQNAKRRLDTFEGMASEAYVSLAHTTDPITAAIEMGKTLRAAADDERYFKAEYLKLADRMSDYLVKLMDNVNDSKELEIILDERNAFSTLELAIQSGEMKFVAHASCQQVLETKWMGPLLDISNSWPKLALVWLCYAVSYPVLCILYILFPRTRIETWMRIPHLKFVGHVIMYLAFLGVLTFMASTLDSTMSMDNARKFSLDSYMNELFKVFKQYSKRHPKLGDNLVIRGTGYSATQVTIIIFIAGLLWQEIKQVYKTGHRVLISDYRNWMDFFMLAFFIAAYACYSVVVTKRNQAMAYFNDGAPAWNALIREDVTAKKNYYYLVADRLYWQPEDPLVIYEVLFAIATLLTFSRIAVFLPASSTLGPLQIGLFKAMKDVMKFLFILLVVFVPFLVSLVVTYWYYSEHNLQKSSMFRSNTTTVSASPYLTSLSATSSTLFWSIFGYSESSYMEIDDYFEKQPITYLVGVVLFAGYHIMIVIVAVNMLIALMSRTIEAVSEEEDMEWKFALTMLHLEYIRDGSTLAAPFNLIPSLKSIFRVVKAPAQFLHNCSKSKSPTSMQMTNINDSGDVINPDGSAYTIDVVDPIASKYDPQSRSEYEAVVKVVTYRFIDKQLDSDVGCESDGKR